MVIWSLLYCVAVAVPLVVGCLALVALGRPWKKYYQRIVLLYGRVMIYVAFFPVVRVRYQDLAPGDNKCGIYIFNHRSASDAFLVGALNVTMIQIVNGWPMRLPFFGIFAKLADFIDATKMTLEEITDHIKKITDTGVSVIVFPEGTRSGGRTMNHFHSGIFRVAQTLKLPVYPCSITGNENLPNRSFRFSVGTAQVRKGAAIPMEWLEHDTAFVLKRKVQNLIAQQITEVEEND